MDNNAWVQVAKSIYKFLFPFKMLSGMLKEQNEYLQRMELRLLRLEIMHTVQNYPTEQEKIMSLYDEYKARGGNSYIDEIYNEWAKRIAAKTKPKRKKK